MKIYLIYKLGSSYDEFIKVFLPWFKEGKRRAETINLPIKYHKHSLKFKDWKRLKSVQLQKINNVYYLNIFWEKQSVQQVEHKNKLGLDLGYNKLISDSNGVHYGKELKQIYIKIANKQRGSKNYKQALVYKKQKINEVVNKFYTLNKDTDFIVENLKSVKECNKLYRNTNNKLQYWSYRQVLDKLEQLSELEGFKIIKVEPAYTSQICSACGLVIKSNRNGEFYNCSCGLVIDADTNAAINILHRGTYCSSTQKT